MSEIFSPWQGNPVITSEMIPLKRSFTSAFNAGATEFNNQILLLIRVEDKKGYSSLAIATSLTGLTEWQFKNFILTAAENSNEAIFGVEDPRITFFERKEYLITYTSFRKDVTGNPHTISIMKTTDFTNFERLGQVLIPPDKDGALFPEKIRGRYALLHRPIVEGRAEIWVSFSPDLKYWGEDRIILPLTERFWEKDRIGIGPPPIKTKEGYLIIYHGVQNKTGGKIYRVGLALLDEDLRIIRRSPCWVLGPSEGEKIIFPCGSVLKEDNLFLYYGVDDKNLSVALANLNEIIDYLKSCPDN
jgi:predicted GH43/DUF377 family glycosyl hydrolase